MSSTITAASVLPELLFKTIHGEPHIGYAQSYIYLGAKLEDLNTVPWFLTWILSLVWLVLLALTVYWTVRRRSQSHNGLIGFLRRNLSILSGTQVTRVESSANGDTNMAAAVGTLSATIGPLFIFYVRFRQVGRTLPPTPHFRTIVFNCAMAALRMKTWPLACWQSQSWLW